MMTDVTTLKNEKVGIFGSGLIGRSWAMLFAAAGYRVVMYDIEPSQVSDALVTILKQLRELQGQGLLRGSLSVEEQHALISGTSDLRECTSDAVYIQECVPERLELKQAVFRQLDPLIGSDVILASSTSSMPASSFTQDLTHRAQVIVVHPTNPPFYCPATEIIPAPYTSDWVKEKTLSMMREIKQVPILLNKEIPGFVLNRLQYALMSECWRLVRDGVVSVDDVDKVVTDGLGPRYAFVGPLETCHLNANGFLDYCKRYGSGIYNVCLDFGPTPEWDEATTEKLMSSLCRRSPLDQLEERWKWRDTRLTALAKLKKNKPNP